MAVLAAGDIKSTTLEAALLEVAQKLQVAEKAVVVGEGITPPDNVSVSFSTDSNTVSVSFTLPITATVDATGQLVNAVVPYA